MNHDLLKRIIYDQHEVIKESVIVDRDILMEEDANYVLVGLRRAGKSTLLYQRAQKLVSKGVSYDQIIYINFDDERLLGFSAADFDDIVLTAEEMSQGKHYYFFDEIQNVPGWEKFAIRMANAKEKVDITGSNAKMLSSDVAAALGGRYMVKEVYPYSFPECLRALGVNPASFSAKAQGRVMKAASDYLAYGGLPEAMQRKLKRDYLSTIYERVLLNDIIVHHGIRQEAAVRLLVKKIAETVGTPVSFARLRDILTGIGVSLSREALLDYCRYFEDGFLLFSLYNHIEGFPEKHGHPKWYFVDNGILSLFLFDKATRLLENAVAIALARRYGKERIFYLKSGGVDIDFYVPEQGALIQAAYSIKEEEALKREVGSLIRYAKSHEGIKRCLIVTNEEGQTIEKDGIAIEVMPLYKFLLGELVKQ